MSNYNSVQQKNCSCSLFVFVLGSFLGERGFLPGYPQPYRLLAFVISTIVLIRSGLGITVVYGILNSQTMEIIYSYGETATDSWVADRNRLTYAGQFIWIGVDYICEPTPWYNQNETPVKRSCFGIVDTPGIHTNDYYLYQS